MIAGPDSLDTRLIECLKTDARASVTALAARLGVSRSTVQDRLRKLERGGTILGYTVTLQEGGGPHFVQALVMISVNSKMNSRVLHALKNISALRRLYTVSGQFDLCAFVSAENTAALDAVLDTIRELPGVEETQSSMLLTTKIDR